MWMFAKSSSTVSEVFYRRGNSNMPFERVGFGDKQVHLGGRLRRALGYTHISPHAGAYLPTLQELQLLWHVKRALPLGWLFHLCSRCEPPSDVRQVSEAPRSDAHVSIVPGGNALVAPFAPSSSIATSSSHPISTPWNVFPRRPLGSSCEATQIISPSRPPPPNDQVHRRLPVGRPL